MVLTACSSLSRMGSRDDGYGSRQHLYVGYRLAGTQPRGARIRQMCRWGISKSMCVALRRCGFQANHYGGDQHRPGNPGRRTYEKPRSTIDGCFRTLSQHHRPPAGPRSATVPEAPAKANRRGGGGCWRGGAAGQVAARRSPLWPSTRVWLGCCRTAEVWRVVCGRWP
jgi:hypothetical protein